MDAGELAMHKTLTTAFILADAESVVFRRREKIEDGAGGFKWTDETPQNEQTVRLIPLSDTAPEVSTPDGQRVKLEWTLLGEFDLNIRRYDLFDFHGSTWQVIAVHPKPDYEVKGDVILHVGG